MTCDKLNFLISQKDDEIQPGIIISVLNDMRCRSISTIDEGSNGALIVVVADNLGCETPCCLSFITRT